MFNLFNKKTENKEVFTQDAKVSKYPTIVDEIHNEFFTAGDKLLEQAKHILSDLELKDIHKGNRLAAIGFHKTKEAVQYLYDESVIKLNKDVSNIIVSYKKSHPFNKFITEQQVELICKKYGLVCGDISIYSGFVPEYKLSIIEKFINSNKNIVEPIYEYGSYLLNKKEWVKYCVGKVY